MAEPTVQSAQAVPVPIITEEQRLKAEEFIALEEGAHHKFAGRGALSCSPSRW